MSDVKEITAPFPGVLYLRADPNSAPYAKPGDSVASGDTVALVEVMKMFHEVRSDITGRLVEFLVEDGDAVSMGQVIARVDAGS